ncbi:thioredoxin [Fusarium sp. NRRL 52700]|nr:thioredoxin [Fusarium sp. NRRL 52700]
MPPVTEIKTQDDYKKLLAKYRFVIINAMRSGPGSKNYFSGIVYDMLSDELRYNPEEFVLARLNIDKEPDLAKKVAEKLDVQQDVPFIVAYKKGMRVDSLIEPTPGCFQNFVKAWVKKEGRPVYWATKK